MNRPSVKRLFALALVLILSVLSLTPIVLHAQAQGTTCPGALASRLVIGEGGRVTPGDPNNMRDAPSLDGNTIGSIPGSAEFAVLDGPVCADAFAWWLVDYEGLVGWTVEGGASYWLEPLADYTPGPAQRVEFGGVSFTLEESVAANAVAELVAERTEVDIPAYANAPEHISFTFEGYTGREFWVELRVIPAQAYADMIGLNFVDDMRDMLDSRPAFPQPVFTPYVNAALLYTAKVEYVDFANGSGVRFLADFAQAIMPVDSIYIFSGLTNDDAYYVEAAFSLTSPPLYNDPSLQRYLSMDFDAFYDNYDAYMDTVMDVLAASGPSDFSPNLDALDALIGSLNVTPVVLSASAQGALGCTLSGDVVVTAQCAGLAFAFADELAFSVDVAIAEPIETSAELARPASFEIRLTGWPTAVPGNPRREALIRIYPLEEYDNISQTAREAIARLDSLLASNAIGPNDALPYLPVVMAAQQYQAQGQIIDGVSVRGIRYLTQFVQNVSPLISSETLYVFQGYSYDFNYYISAQFPVETDLLAPNYGSDAVFNAITDYQTEYRPYVERMVALLNNASSADFSPDLADIDAIFESLQIDPALLIEISRMG